MSLLRTAFWIALFLASTFLFTVLFEYGTENFRDDAKKEYLNLRVLFGIDPDPSKKPPPKPGEPTP
jgi:hypothetical protein